KAAAVSSKPTRSTSVTSTSSQDRDPDMPAAGKNPAIPVDIENEMRTSYLDYAMSVIVGRALPDARDGLKPVHRRVLYAMEELGNQWNKPTKKSAKAVGEVM